MKYTESDYKKILNIEEKYTLENLKNAYREAVKNNHPDKFKNPINKKLATEKMKLINEAYEYLKEHVDKQSNNYNNKTDSHKTYNNSNAHQKSDEEQARDTNTNYNNKNANSNILKILEFCINNHKKMHMKYVLKTGDKIDIDIIPLELVFGLYKEDLLYFKAFSSMQNKTKTYRVDRIIKNEILEDLNTNDFNAYNSKNINNSITQKSILDITVLLPIITGLVIILSFFKVPYTIYMILRVLVCLTFLNTVLTLRKFMPSYAVLICILGIILYNPIYPIHLAKSTWQIMDIGILIELIYLLKGYFKDE